MSNKRSRVDGETPSDKYRREHGSQGEYRQEADSALHDVYDIIANAEISEKDPGEMTLHEIQQEMENLRYALRHAKDRCEATMSERPGCAIM